MRKKIVESMMEGQPDKLCDRMADALVDAYLKRDPNARVDLQVFGSRGMIVIGGEVDSMEDLDCARVVKEVYARVGYLDVPEVFVNIEPPSDQVKKNNGLPMDTVAVTGYATRETRERLPRSLVYAHNLARRIDDLRRTDPGCSWLLPDGKVQIITQKDRVHTVTLLASHAKDMHVNDVRKHLLERALYPVLGEEGMQIFVNPLGDFSTCGFSADSGVNGRCHDVDTYGGLIPSGNQHLSGKDPRKAERAGTYMARFVARAFVEQEIADMVYVSVGYTVGRAEPIFLQAHGMTKKSRGVQMDLTALVAQSFDFRPEAIVERLNLARPIYEGLAAYGQVGRVGVPWEQGFDEEKLSVVS